MNHEHDDGDGPGPSDADAPVPAVGRPSRDVPVARQPMEQIGRAMQVQSELLKQMHERQRMLEDVVKDNRRHELMINSAQALNESFQGLQRVQQRLADKLDDARAPGRGGFAMLAVAVLLLAGVGGVVAWRIMLGADAINENIKTALDPKARDRELQAGISKLEARIKGVEEADRAAFQDEIEKLRRMTAAITTENEQLRRERDGAREELGAVKASLGGTQAELADLKARTQELEKDNARLTGQGLADQSTIVQLNELIATLRGAVSTSSPPPAGPASGTGAGPGEQPPVAAAARNDPPGVTASPPVDPPTKSEGVASAASGVVVPFPAAGVETLNTLLKSHRGSDRYELKKVEKVGQQKLWNVLMEVRGTDGGLLKTIEAQSLGFAVDPKRDILDLEFQGGSVTFHQGATGRSTKSPFFNDRYLIVVLLNDAKAWLATNQPFVREK